MFEASREAVYLKNLIHESARNLYSINLLSVIKRALKLASSQQCHCRSKHIDERYHYIRN